MPADLIAAARIILVVADASPEMPLALAYACAAAQRQQARVGLVTVIAPMETQGWMSVDSLMRAEARSKAEALLQTHTETVLARTGQLPALFIREGQPLDALIALMGEETGILSLVLAAAGQSDNPGPLIRALTAPRVLTRLRTPLTIVPAGLSPDEAAAHA